MNNDELNKRLLRIRGVPYTRQPTYKRLEETLADIRNHFRSKSMSNHRTLKVSDVKEVCYQVWQCPKCRAYNEDLDKKEVGELTYCSTCFETFEVVEGEG